MRDRIPRGPEANILLVLFSVLVVFVIINLEFVARILMSPTPEYLDDRGSIPTDVTALPWPSETPLAAGDLSLLEAEEDNAQAGTPDPYAQPIFDETDVIARSRAALPDEASEIRVEARLVSRETLARDWFDEDGGDWMPDAPLWIVGLEAEGMTMGDSIQLAPGIGLVPDATPVGGMFFIWDATDGGLVSSGALRARQIPGGPTPMPSAYDFRIERIADMRSEDLVIEHATQLP